MSRSTPSSSPSVGSTSVPVSTKPPTSEFQVLVFATSLGSSLFPLTDESLGVGKSLLKVANRPFLWYQLDMVEKAGFPHVTVLTRDNFANNIVKAIIQWQSKHTSANTSSHPSPMPSPHIKPVQPSPSLGPASSGHSLNLPSALSLTPPAIGNNAPNTTNNSSASSTTNTNTYTIPADIPTEVDETGLLRSYFVNKGRLSVEVIAIKQYQGTAHALRQIQHKITTDFFVLSGDLISNVQFQNMADLHRSHDAAMVLCCQAPSESSAEREAAEKKKSEDDELDRQFIGLEDLEGDRSSTNGDSSSIYTPGGKRLLIYQAQADVEEVLGLKRKLLQSHPQVTLHSKLRDIHLYLFSRWVIHLLNDKKAISSIQVELVPCLVQGQFKEDYKKWKEDQENFSNDQNRRRNTNYTQAQELALSMSHTPSSLASNTPVTANDAYKCLLWVSSSSSFSCRGNTLSAYKNLNHEMALDKEYTYMPWNLASVDSWVNLASKQFPKASLGGGGVVIGEHCTFGELATVKRSCVGSKCNIATKVKMNGCIIGDNVTIEEGVTLQDCLVASGAVIGKGSTLKECKVGQGFVVPAATEAKNEILVHEESEAEDN